MSSGVADRNEKSAAMEISKPQASMPTVATSCKVLYTYKCAARDGGCALCA